MMYTEIRELFNRIELMELFKLFKLLEIMEKKNMAWQINMLKEMKNSWSLHCPALAPV